MRILCLIFILLCSPAAAVEFGPVSDGKQSDDRQTINSALDTANHCNSDKDCGSAKFDCKEQLYNRNEGTVADAVNKYNSNAKYNHKCTAQSKAPAQLLCRDGKCVAQ